MPDPGSHRYDVRRVRLRAEADDQGVPDQHADRAADVHAMIERNTLATATLVGRFGR